MGLRDMINFRNKLKDRIAHFKKDKEGATAIEFALLAVPFFMLLFAILELAIIFFISSTLNFAVSEAGRQIRTGNYQNCGQESFKRLVCANMFSVGDCQNNLSIDVKSGATFGAITLTEPLKPSENPPPEPDPLDPDAEEPPTIPNGEYDQTITTSADVPVVVRALYYHFLILPKQLTRLETLEGENVHLIRSTTAFQNEPFPPQGATCA